MSETPNEFKLRVAGVKYTGWTSLRVTRSLEELASSFAVRLTDLWAEAGDPIPIEGGNACSISIDGEMLIAGYVDKDSLDYDTTSRTIGFSGRSKTEDLVDCAAIHKGGQWRDSNLLTIAADLCSPFGIDVSAGVPLGAKFRRFSIQEAETAFNAIERAARMRGVLALTDADGNLRLDRVSTTCVDTVLEYGKNIKRGSRVNDWQDRFSTYIVKTQSAGTDTHHGAACSIKRSSDDEGVTRYRPTIIMAENEDSGTELQKRADWERNVRAGRGKRLTYTTRGWRHSTGLWAPNQLVRVIDPNARVDDKLLTASVTQTRDENGTLTTLELTMKEAFDVQPLPAPKKKAGAFR